GTARATCALVSAIDYSPMDHGVLLRPLAPGSSAGGNCPARTSARLSRRAGTRVDVGGFMPPTLREARTAAGPERARPRPACGRATPVESRPGPAPTPYTPAQFSRVASSPCA